MIFLNESFSSTLAYAPQPYSVAMDMGMSATYTPCDISSKGETGDIMMFSQF